MFDYEKAPYLELKDYPAPNGIKSFFVPMNDSKKIRLAYWKHLSKKHRVAVLFYFSKGTMNS